MKTTKSGYNEVAGIRRSYTSFGPLIVMNSSKNDLYSRRLKILGKDEIPSIFEMPSFTAEERINYFSLTGPEHELLDQFGSLASKTYFVLQAGYFKARHLFFNFEFSRISEDAEYVLRTHFSDRKVELESLRTVARNTRLKQQRALLQLYGFCR